MQATNAEEEETEEDSEDSFACLSDHLESSDDDIELIDFENEITK